MSPLLEKAKQDLEEGWQPLYYWVLAGFVLAGWILGGLWWVLR